VVKKGLLFLLKNDCPQTEQNTELGKLDDPHLGQFLTAFSSIFVPQLSQKIAFSDISPPHLGHLAIFPPLPEIC